LQAWVSDTLIDKLLVVSGEANDWWMLGILTFELLLGTTPFRGEGMATLHTSITTQELTFSPVILDDDDNALSEAIPPPKISAQAEGFVARLLEKDPLARLGGEPEVQADLWWGDLDWEALARKVIAPPEEIAPVVSDDPLFYFPERSDSFAADGDLAFHAPARSGTKSGSDPFMAAKRGAVNDFYFDRNEARKKAAERDVMEARFKAAAAAAGAPTDDSL
jgi:serine/threonine protein kinase